MDRPIDRVGRYQRWSRRLPLVTLCCGLLFSAAVGLHVHCRTTAVLHAEFRHNATRVARQVKHSLFHSEPHGAVRTLGRANVRLLAAAKGRLPPDFPSLAQSLQEVQTSFGASVVYAMNKEGDVVVSTRYDGTNSLTGANFAMRPYFARAIQGCGFVEIAFGIKTLQRGIYHSAPIYDDRIDGQTSPSAVGVVVIKMPMETIDQQMSDTPDIALLVSPEGVVYAANRPDWVFGYILGDPPRVPSGRPEFDLVSFKSRLQPLPVRLRGMTALVAGRPHHAETFPLAMGDPRGNWRLIVLRDKDTWSAAFLQAGFAALLTAGVCLLTGIAAQQRLKRLTVRAENLRALTIHRTELEQIARKRMEALQSVEAKLQRETEGRLRALEQARILRERLNEYQRGTHGSSDKPDAYAMEPLDLNALVSQVLRSDTIAALRHNRPDLSLLHRTPPRDIHVRGRPMHIERIIMAIVERAARATPEHGTVTLQTAARVSDHHAFTASDASVPRCYASIAVSNSGVGMADAEWQSFLDSPLTDINDRAHVAPSVRSIVEEHGGHCDMRNVPGQGSEIDVFLPLLEEKEDMTPTPEKLQDGIRILVVDDDDAQRSLAKRILNKLGYAAKTANNGHDAVEIVQRAAACGEHYSLILLDMVMEDDFDGLDTLLAIRREAPEQKIVIASGYAPDERSAEAQKLGAMWLSKPYSIAELDSAIRQALRPKAAAPERLG